MPSRPFATDKLAWQRLACRVGNPESLAIAVPDGFRSASFAIDRTPSRTSACIEVAGLGIGGKSWVSEVSLVFEVEVAVPLRSGSAPDARSPVFVRGEDVGEPSPEGSPLVRRPSCAVPSRRCHYEDNSPLG